MPTGFFAVPDWFAWDNQGAGIALADLDGDARPELIVMMIDSPPGQNRGLYRVGRALDEAGAVTGGWGAWREVPDWFAWENQGGGIAVADLNADGHPELVVFMIDNAAGANQGYYRIGLGLDANGVVTGGWSPWIPIPDWFPWENQHGSIAVADLDLDGRPELIVMMIDNAAEENQAYYRVGRRLDANGVVTGGWEPWLLLPDWFSWENQGAGLAVADSTIPGRRDLIVFHIDNPIGLNQAFFRIGRDLRADGTVAEWGPWRGAPDWFSWDNQGSGVAVTRLGGKQKLLALTVDNPPQENAGLYEVIDLEHDPATSGQWELLSFHSGVLAVHAAVLHTGKVLFFAGSGSSATRFNSPDFGNEGHQIFTSAVWNPSIPPGPGSPNFSHPATLRTAQGKPFDFFCGGDAFLADGRMLSAGGTLNYNPFKGRADVAIFDPVTETWSFAAKMQHGRWYPTLTTLGDGRVLATTGLNEAGNARNQALEIYSAATNAWQQLHFTPGFPGLPLYAHLFLMRDGRIFFSGGRMDDPLQVEPCLIDLTHNPVTTAPVPDLLDPVLRNQSASVLLPPAQDQKVMICGGGPIGKESPLDATGMVSIVDLKAAAPKYAAASPMKLPRLHLNAVLLPDRTVFVSGGSLKQEDEPLARLEAEIYDPATDTWQLMAPATVPRLYHSTALLLPDGRVVAAGGNPEGGHSVKWEPPDPEEEMRLEVFSPPYLFRGPRPTIASVPAEWSYGQTLTIQSPQAAAVKWVSLIKNGVTTHSFDSAQRLVDVAVLFRGGGAIQVRVTTERNLAPPGWYMLFITNSVGVPSVASWIHLT
jgi:Domain of unknown function (DUF1929)/FG-GAP-like repeat